ncbi:MAG TPA: flavodoxin family protein, partial [Candidatus Binatia bacterium]|nr:flavodoxin family protein [Candidatus Binatia bacterium]
MPKPTVRRGMPSVQLTRDQFAKRFRERFYDPSFAAVSTEIEKILAVAWKNYVEYHKSPRTRRAGPNFADPDFHLPVEWLETRAAIMQAEARRKDAGSKSRVLLINGSSRSDQTCPGEVSKTYRLAKIAEEIIARAPGFEVDLLDLSRLASEYGRLIHPCKACVSTAMPLCHWPCSCYPNHAMGQVNDWMAEIYPRWAAAHGVMILCPVYWYQASSPLKLMMDRLVCADGGNPDPTLTGGKNPERAKKVELGGWHYPRHLAGRVFSVVVHGDAAGAETLRRSLSDWLSDMGLIAAGYSSQVEGYVGYYKPYATSHEDLDKDKDFQTEVRNAALSLVHAVRLQR